MDEVSEALPMDWELLKEPFVVEHIIEHGDLDPNIKNIEVYRDVDYQIKLKFSGFGAKPLSNKNHERDYIPGRLIKIPTVRGNDKTGTTEIFIEEAFQNNITIRGDGVITGDGSATRIRVYYRKLKPDWMAIWLLNGKLDHWPRTTERIEGKSFVCRRGKHQRERKVTLQTKHLSRDHLKVDLDEIMFILANVPKEFAPAKLLPVVLEIEANNGKFPSDDIVDSVIELVGFILGRTLHRVDSSVFDSKNYPIEQKAVTHNAPDLRRECDNPGHFPIPLNISNDWIIVERTITTLLQQYLKQRSELSLRNALWRSSIARRLPLGSNLPHFSSAIEAIMNAWFSSKSSKSGGAYLPNKEYQKRIKPAIELIKGSISDINGSKKILSKIVRANQFGVNEKYEIFFEELGLKIGKIERDALRAKNVAAHGGRFSKDYQRLVNTCRAYETLFHRVMLRVLEFQGPYIDYSTYGFPTRKLDEPLGGNPEE